MLSVSVASKIAQAIVNHQQSIIGPLALEQAKKVPGIVISANSVSVSEHEQDPTQLIGSLVKKYAELFGTTSVEVCKDAVKELQNEISVRDLPPILQ